MTSSEIIKKLKDDGWFLVNSEGSHHKFKHLAKKGAVTVKHPCKDIPVGTLRSIYRQADWKWR